MPDRSEKDLILPALWLMSNSENYTTDTTTLIESLTEILKPIDKDARQLKNRKDTHFSQKVRNLKSHNVLDGLAVYQSMGGGKSGLWTITPKGQCIVKDNVELLTYLFENDFTGDDIVTGLKQFATEEVRRLLKIVNKRGSEGAGITNQAVTARAKSNKNSQVSHLKLFDENVLIREGKKKITESSTYERSKQLRDYAVNYYSQNGHIKCQVCRFDFLEKYGELGRNFIEIHHKYPIFMTEGENLQQKLSEAVTKVSPLCSNCHRMIHRSRKKLISVEDLRRKFERNNQQ
ncbi:hypothetical protein [Nitrosococcus wardiae]|uniref:HNH endonuclease n=1 Tax=Nitrosococcus wardiae TaxID=1814290 RepID=A0A4P7BXB7_9GAMM|nr:hypothetical protein [Nitrosococcus wardiae]QBQ53082.1 hypothetical protein E3U44_00090 [Nitrosococcus wardiae]QBQ56362.1 hypothetical protein E3U44_19050 [Nitrosococcus wardiae]QBQ56380.1 hypothetical protein E3U44_19140 [Nitrosococcus wardiae]